MEGMTAEEKQQYFNQWRAQLRQQRIRSSEQFVESMTKEAWKRFLRITEPQWKMIEPRLKKEQEIDSEARVHSLGGGGLGSPRYQWKKHSEGSAGTSAKTLEEMTEGERIVDELIDLLEDDKSTDEAIQKKIDAIKKAREKYSKAVTQSQRGSGQSLNHPAPGGHISTGRSY
jgi:hypothetical protein